MARSVLIVEDEIFVAMEVQHVLTEMGHIPVGIAANRREALELGQDVDIALVDLNLRDGPTGIDIGRQLAVAERSSEISSTAWREPAGTSTWTVNWPSASNAALRFTGSADSAMTARQRLIT